MFKAWDQRFQSWQFTRKQQQAFLEDMLSLIEDGVPATSAIETIREISFGVNKEVARAIETVIAQGKPLADGLEPWFARPIVEIIRAGEMGGTLTGSLRSAVASFASQTGVIRSLINSLLYPLIVVILAMAVLVFIKDSVLVNFLSIKPLSQWPSLGVTLFNFASDIQSWWWLWLLIMACIAYVMIVVLTHVTGKIRQYVDVMPVLSLYRAFAAARFMETLGLLLANGVVLKKALFILQREASPYLLYHLTKMQYRLSGGHENVAEVLDTDLIQRDDLVRLRVVAKGKGFDQALVSLGRKARERHSRSMELAGKIGGGVLLAVGAFIAATLVLGIYTVGSSIAY